MAILAILATVLTCIVLLPIAWVVCNFSPGKYKRLKDLENQRRALAYQIARETHESDWLTKLLFRRYLKKGGDFL
jgi:hypothetical protein